MLHPSSTLSLAATAIETNLYLVSRNTKDLANSGAAVFDRGMTDIGAFPLASFRREMRPIA